MAELPRAESITEALTERAEQLDSGFEEAAAGLLGEEMISSDKLAVTYLQATYEERQEMFVDILSRKGVKGLDVIREIFGKAAQMHRARTMIAPEEF